MRAYSSLPTRQNVVSSSLTSVASRQLRLSKSPLPGAMSRATGSLIFWVVPGMCGGCR